MIKYLFITMVCFCFFSSTARTDDIYGLMMVVKGDVSVIGKDKKEQKAHIGIKVYPGDTVVTKADARAKIVMVDKNVINISPDSKFLIEKYVYNPDADKKGALINVIYGKIRTTVNQKYDGEKNTFRVKTQTAVAGVRGTDFIVSYSETTNSSKVVTFTGRVEVGSGIDASGHIQGSVFVTPGNFTVAALHQGPVQPTPVPPQELTSMKESSLADSLSNNKDKGDSRQPSSTKDDSKSNSKNNSNDHSNSPSGSNGSAPAQSPGPASVSGPASGIAPQPGTSALGEMGENIAAPAITAPPPPPPVMPFAGTTAATNPCLTGSCVPTVPPNLFKGSTKVIVNLQP